jgi:hypothetical protein
MVSDAGQALILSVAHITLRNLRHQPIMVRIMASRAAIGASLRSVSQRLRRSISMLRFPGRDLVGMDIEDLRQFGQRLLALDGGQSHLERFRAY